MTSSSRRSLPIGQLIVLGLLLVLFLLGAAPGYLRGSWAWQSTPANAALESMRQIPRLGLELPGWETLSQEKAQIAGQTWSAQTIAAPANSTKPDIEPGTELLVLIHPQLDPKDMPKVEWTNLQGHFRWTEDQLSRVQLSSSEGGNKLSARFLRGWTEQNTYGLMAWYAQPNGGSPAPGDWFWRDRRAQLRGERTPWMAVVVMQAMEPLGQVEDTRNSLTATALDVQAAIDKLFATTT